MCEIGGEISSLIYLYRGAGQGDPFSSIKFNLVHSFYMSYVRLRQIELIPNSLPREIDGTFLPSVMYADDTVSPILLDTQENAIQLTSIYKEAKLLTGLEVNEKNLTCSS